jgi:hypothetical protein
MVVSLWGCWEGLMRRDEVYQSLELGAYLVILVQIETFHTRGSTATSKRLLSPRPKGQMSGEDLGQGGMALFNIPMIGTP